MGMDENPYESPIEVASPRKFSWDLAWSGFLWATIAFGAGTGMVAPLVLSTEPRDRVIGGMIFGGLPLAFVGLLYGLRRARRREGFRANETHDEKPRE
jgi:hypothetical protein